MREPRVRRKPVPDLIDGFRGVPPDPAANDPHLWASRLLDELRPFGVRRFVPVVDRCDPPAWVAPGLPVRSRGERPGRGDHRPRPMRRPSSTGWSGPTRQCGEARILRILGMTVGNRSAQPLDVHAVSQAEQFGMGQPDKKQRVPASHV